ncbi:MAG: hypothetical protein IPI89_09900 [Propionivibrio sp.]|nr:hypothetical protein [Propionivibrio sp.]
MSRSVRNIAPLPTLTTARLTLFVDKMKHQAVKASLFSSTSAKRVMD